MTDKRVTLGQQILDNQAKYAGQKTQTIRETTDEMGKEYMRSLERTVLLNKSCKHDYYIMEIMRPDANLIDVVNLKHISRRTRPKPEWGVALYKYHQQSGHLTYEWGLPAKHEALIMMQNPEGWEPKSIKDIRDYVQGTLAQFMSEHQCFKGITGGKIDIFNSEGINRCRGTNPMYLECWFEDRAEDATISDNWIMLKVNYCPFCGLKSEGTLV